MENPEWKADEGSADLSGVGEVHGDLRDGDRQDDTMETGAELNS